MDKGKKNLTPAHDKLMAAMADESRKFQECYLWLEKAMPQNFFDEMSHGNIMLVAHGLMGFPLQDYCTTINLKHAAIVLCLDSTEADVKILEKYRDYGIKNYQAFISTLPPPYPGLTQALRIVIIHFTEVVETVETPYPVEAKEELRRVVQQHYLDLSDEAFDTLIGAINTRFLRAMPIDRVALALDMFFRAKTRDHCQYEVRYNEDWKERNLPSMQIVLAWRNTPKQNFLYQLARMVQRHNLVMKRVNATYIDPYSKHSILIMSLELHGANGQAVWDVANIADFLRELVMLKYFDEMDQIDTVFVETRLLTGNQANLLRSMVNFIHQTLVYLDPYRYTVENIEEGLCRHPELSVKLCQLFALKFDPDTCNLTQYNSQRTQLLTLIDKLDTGQEVNDERRKNILKQGMSFIDHTLKTNFYRNNKTSFSFRLDPAYLDNIPFNRKSRFPELPYAIFYMRGMRFFGFHIRFKDLARGGLRTVYPEETEGMMAERNNVFSECYNLAYTQHKKNKDIPEGGAKGVIFLRPFDRMESEAQILEKELKNANIELKEIDRRLSTFRQEQKVEYLHQSQRSYIESLITIINCDPDGTLRAKHIVDYWKRPEYIYLGPDENMHDAIIQWIADFAKKYDYKPGGAFISSKPKAGINHKEYGVTSLGLNVYVDEVLKFLGINPKENPFTVKMSGGPDGDVAGNEIVNLYKFYPTTAQLIALTDGSGTVNDPQGLDLSYLVDLFKQGKAIRHYPPEKLSPGGFLLDRTTRRADTAYSQQTLCWRRKNGKIVEDWLSGSDMNFLYGQNVHATSAGIFIPAGGRPRTLNQSNIKVFLDDRDKPTAQAIVEGANLYLTPEARRTLEELGVIIIKDSSANKGGVICSSFEVLCGLTLGDDLFLKHKEQLVKEILDRLQQCSLNEARLLLKTYKETGEFLTDISDKISERINKYTYELLDFLDTQPLSNDPTDPLVKCFLDYCLPTLKEKFQDELLKEIPEHHKKAIIACHVASQLVYKKGLTWSPSIIEVLPLVLKKMDHA